MHHGTMSHCVFVLGGGCSRGPLGDGGKTACMGGGQSGCTMVRVTACPVLRGNDDGVCWVGGGRAGLTQRWRLGAIHALVIVVSAPHGHSWHYAAAAASESLTASDSQTEPPLLPVLAGHWPRAAAWQRHSAMTPGPTRRKAAGRGPGRRALAMACQRPGAMAVGKAVCQLLTPFVSRK